MKKALFVVLCLTYLISMSTVFADAIGPEFPEPYRYHTVDISPVVYVVIAIVIVVVSCIVSALINKKENNNNIADVTASEEKKGE